MNWHEAKSGLLFVATFIAMGSMVFAFVGGVAVFLFWVSDFIKQ